MILRPYSTAVASVLFAVVATGASAQSDSVAGAPSQPTVVRHTVKRGDTLWDIANFYLKDPFRWPKVFHANTDIVKNPHWIYPGQVLTIPADAVRDDIAARVDQNGYVVSQFQTRPASASSGVSGDVVGRPPSSTIREGEYEAAPFVVGKKQPFPVGKIVGAVDRPALGLVSDAGYTIYDRLYVTSPPGVTLQKGDWLLLANRSDAIPDVGQVIEPTGLLRVDSIQENGPVLGTVMKQFREIKAGYITVAYKRTFQPTTVRPVVGTYPVAAKVLWIRHQPPFPSVQTYLILGVSPNADVHPGDQFTLYDQTEREASTHIPPVATAIVQVVRVTPAGVSGIIIRQSEPQIQEKMPARLTAKMP